MFLFWFILLLGFDPWSEVWAHRKLWEPGSCNDDEPFTLWCIWTPGGYKGWKLELLLHQMPPLWLWSPNCIVQSFNRKISVGKNNSKCKCRPKEIRPGSWLMTSEVKNMFVFELSLSSLYFLRVQEQMRLVWLRFCHHAPMQKFRKSTESTKLVSSHLFLLLHRAL